MSLPAVTIPGDLQSVLVEAWAETRNVQGHLEENEAGFLGMLAAGVRARGAIVKIGSFRFVESGTELHGVTKRRYKFNPFRVRVVHKRSPVLRIDRGVRNIPAEGGTIFPNHDE